MNSCAGGLSKARLRAVALTAAVALVAAACAQASPSGGSNPDDNVIPELGVLNVGTGDTVDLGNLVPAPRPILLWFWAPH